MCLSNITGKCVKFTAYEKDIATLNDISVYDKKTALGACVCIYINTHITKDSYDFFQNMSDEMFVATMMNKNVAHYVPLSIVAKHEESLLNSNIKLAIYYHEHAKQETGWEKAETVYLNSKIIACTLMITGLLKNKEYIDFLITFFKNKKEIYDEFVAWHDVTFIQSNSFEFIAYLINNGCENSTYLKKFIKSYSVYSLVSVVPLITNPCSIFEKYIFSCKSAQHFVSNNTVQFEYMKKFVNTSKTLKNNIKNSVFYSLAYSVFFTKTRFIEAEQKILLSIKTNPPNINFLIVTYAVEVVKEKWVEFEKEVMDDFISVCSTDWLWAYADAIYYCKPWVEFENIILSMLKNHSFLFSVLIRYIKNRPYEMKNVENTLLEIINDESSMYYSELGKFVLQYTATCRSSGRWDAIEDKLLVDKRFIEKYKAIVKEKASPQDFAEVLLAID